MCEAACSLQHLDNLANPRRSRIRVFIDSDTFFPIIAGPFTEAECNAKNILVIGRQEYNSCDLCRASCPSRPIFREPDLDIPLKCDFCGEPPDPACVKWCGSEALMLVEVPDRV